MTSIYSYLFTAFYEWLRDNDANPRIMVDASKPGVRVPQQYVTGGMILISIYHLYVSEFTIGPTMISFYTKFKGKKELVVIPYSAMTELVCSDSGFSIPLNMWLASIDLACHQCDLTDWNDEEELMRELDRHTEELMRQEQKEAMAAHNKISFSIDESTPENYGAPVPKGKKGADAKAEESSKPKPKFTVVE